MEQEKISGNIIDFKVLGRILKFVNPYRGIFFLNSSIKTGLSGRGPTTLISPFNTLKNCGSSSRLVFLRNVPSLVRLGSFSFAHTAPV